MTDVLAELINHLENTEVNAQMFSKQEHLDPAYRQQFVMFAEAARAALRLANDAIGERELLRAQLKPHQCCVCGMTAANLIDGEWWCETHISRY